MGGSSSKKQTPATFKQHVIKANRQSSVYEPSIKENDSEITFERGSTSLSQVQQKEQKREGAKEVDPRYEYLIRSGIVKLEQESILFVELPEIPAVWIGYRKQGNRTTQKLSIDGLDLNHVPLLEGEEKLRSISMRNNRIIRVENFEGLPNLIEIDLTNNEITDISDLSQVRQLRVLKLSANRIREVSKLDHLSHLIWLDLSCNALRRISGLTGLTALKVLNLSENWITEIEGLDNNTALIELNMNRNAIRSINGLYNQRNQLRILTLGFNSIANSFNIAELRNMTVLSDIILEGNPIASERRSYLEAILEVATGSLETIDLVGIAELKAERNGDVKPTMKRVKKKDKKEKIEDVKPTKLIKMVDSLDNKVIKTNGINHSSGTGVLPKRSISKKENTYRASPLKTIVESPIREELGQKRRTSKYSQSLFQLQQSPPQQQSCQKGLDYHHPLTSHNSRLNTDQHYPQPKPPVHMTFQNEFELENCKNWERIAQEADKYEQNGASIHELRGMNIPGSTVSERHDKSIYIFTSGNSAESLLQDSSFQQSANSLDISYTIFSIVLAASEGLRKFKRLHSLSLRSTSLSDFLSLSKLPLPSTIRSLTITDCPLAQCTMLRDFVIYRFPFLTHFNNSEIRVSHTEKAFQQFYQYDLILQLPQQLFSPADIRPYPSLGSEKHLIFPTRLFLTTVASIADESVGKSLQEVFNVEIPAISQADSFISLLLESTV